MPYDSKAVANHFLKLAGEQGGKITPMKLQKLVYFAHGWHLALTGKPLIYEPVQAWKFGPVIDKLYFEFKGFGNKAITRKANEVKSDPAGGIVKYEPSMDDEPNDRFLIIAKAVVERVHKLYGHLTGLQLSSMTHREGTPWQLVQKMYPKELPSHATIPNETIREHFQEILKAKDRQTTQGTSPI